ncbi:MAG: CYTH and CHAD domain-containing protein [Betaproteobacteria bacterium]
MPEQELKLYVPESSRAKLERALRRGAITQTPLRAIYFDTPSRELARQNIALRLRLEGQQWVQTLKTPGDTLISRLEFKHERSGSELDLSVYQGTQAAMVLERLSQPLLMRYETRVLRTHRLLRVPGGLVEIALDQGCIQAGELQLPVQEFEVELKRGSLTALLGCAKKWQHQHALILDLRSKSERGDQLATLAQKLQAQEGQAEDARPEVAQAAVAAFWQPHLSQPMVLRPEMTAQEALAAVIAACMEQIIRNAALLAGVDACASRERKTTEHLHQLRVGIRRLRSAWSLFKGVCELPEQTAMQSLKELFGQLGSSRDEDVLLQSLWPKLQAAGQPPLTLDADITPEHPELLVRSPRFQAWQLDMLGFIHQPAPLMLPAQTQIEPKRPSLKKVLRLTLQGWHRQVLQQGLRFETLQMDERHELRKRVKRLRYALQFVDALLPRKKIKPYLKRLARLQDLLGQMNDLVVARHRFEALRESQPGAWFACGWISAELKSLDANIRSGFGQLAKTDHYWQ